MCAKQQIDRLNRFWVIVHADLENTEEKDFEKNAFKVSVCENHIILLLTG